MQLFQTCTRCGQTHNRAWDLLLCHYGDRFAWLTGQGRYAVISHCPPAVAVWLYATPEEAKHAKAYVTWHGCGLKCHEDHLLLDLVTGLPLTNSSPVLVGA